jgi:hypothetical protein
MGLTQGLHKKGVGHERNPSIGWHERQDLDRHRRALDAAIRGTGAAHKLVDVSVLKIRKQAMALISIHNQARLGLS